MNILRNLISFLENKNLNKYAEEIYKLAAPAEPFLAWFEGEERVYLPYGSNSKLNEEELRKRHPYILEAARYMGFDESSISLYKKSLDINARSAKRVRIALPFYTKFFEKKLNDILESEDSEVKESFSERFLNIFWGSSYLTQIPQMMEEFKENFSTEKFINIQTELLNGVRNFKNYDSDDLRETSVSKSDKMVVISRAEEDVENMSTNRRWTSCMDLQGSHAEEIAGNNVYCEVENGGFIAYLTSADDYDVRDPYSRVLIRRFDSRTTNKSIAIPESTVYGQEDSMFLEIVESWVEEKQGQIEYGEYELMGMEYSDEHEGVDIFGIPEGISADEIIKNPNSLFNYSDTIYLVQDALAIPIFIEEMPEESKELEVFEGYKVFNSIEELRFLYNYSKDNISKLKNDILSRIYLKRIEHLKDEVCEIGGDLDNGDYVDLKNSDLVDALIAWVNYNFSDNYDLWHKIDAHYEEFIDFLEDSPAILEKLSEQNYDGITVNKFDRTKPFYSFEFQIESILNEEKERYSHVQISKDEYFKNLNEYRPILYTSMITSALKFSRENPNGLSEEAMEKLKYMKDRSNSRKTYAQLVLRNSDNSDQKDLKEIIETIIISFNMAIKNLISNKKSHDTFSFNITNNVEELKYFIINSSDKNLIEKCEEEIQKGVDTILSSELKNKEKIKALKSIARSFSINGTYYSDLKIPIELNKFFKFVFDEDEKVDLMEHEATDLKKLIINSKNLNPEYLKRIFENVYSIDVRFEDPDDGGGAQSPISLREKYERGNFGLSSESFLKIISEEKNREALSEEIDNVLSKLSVRINKVIGDYKKNLEWKDGPEAARYFKKRLKLELDVLFEFSKKLLEIIK